MRTTAFVAGAALILTAAGPALSAESIRVADSFPVGHYIAENLLKPFMDEVTEKTGTEFEYFPAQQLGKAKDMLNLTQTGVADIGYVGASYVSDKLPLSSVGELPEAFTTACEGTMAFWEIAKPGGVLDQAEYAPNGVRVLMVLVLSPYQMFSTKEITGLDSFKGLKIRSTGGAKEIAINKLGGVPVQMAAPEAREALSRGTVDAIVFPYSSVLPYDLTPHLSYATHGLNFGSFVATYMISEAKWNALSPEMQAVLSDAGENANRTACEAAERLAGEDKATIAAGGVEFVDFPEADAEKLEAMMAEVSAEWAAEQDGFGRPGTDVLNAFRDALKK
ncbi:C4-dicarboxylate ABC transporter [Pikeienuella piscinae]|uniref:C4-dicarboxylate ABC transporter n=1 Tax=Pikeienuella piscinae TaxID=2748098 RepID=A0A7L5BUR9_9RHOB|nr:TRAP transporter substrate-binding protein DctP [Pikeienuella piscinae]QIE55041.1 C4-dicarboxylate ABC transporter [Pikeienuella piscinae]